MEPLVSGIRFGSCGIVSDLRHWTCTLRRARRLRSLLSRVMAAGSPRFPHRCFPKYGLADSQLAPRDVVFLEEHLAGELLFATCTKAAIFARQVYGC